MPVSVTMPQLGESVTEGTVTRWLKQVGDRVEADEPLLEVSTDKVDTEIPSPASGTLVEIKVNEDDTADVGSELAIIAGDGEESGAAQPASQDGTAQPDSRPANAEAGQSEPVPSEPASSEPEPAQAEAQAPPVDAADLGEPATEHEPEAEQPALSAESAPATQPPPAEQPSAPATPPASAEQPSAPASGSAGGTVVTMPALGESVTEGTVTRWLKQVGDSVVADEPLLEVSTDKVDTEIPSPAAGTLVEIKVPEDETVAVGAELAVIGSAGAAASAPAPEPSAPVEAAAPQPTAPTPRSAPPADEASPPPRPEAPQPAPQQPPAAAAPQSAPATAPPAAAPPAAAPAAAVPAAAATTNGSAGRDEDAAYVTPLVRKLATEHGVNLASLSGTGVGGRIRKQDVISAAEQQRAAERAAAAPAASTPSVPASVPKPAATPSPLRGRTEKMTRMRQLIARRMVESLQTSAQLTTVVEVDVTKIARLRDQAKADFAARNGVKLSFLPFFALATVEALRVHPNVNASIDMESNTITYHDAEHLGMAVDTERGLMVPVIRDAGDLNLAGLARRIADLADRTRTNKVTPDELSGGTFTLTNTGSRGALFDTPIINQPQVGILGTGAVVRRAVVVEDEELGEIIVPRSMVYLALSYDHRIVDGADAARFLSTVKQRLEAGDFERDLGV